MKVKRPSYKEPPFRPITLILESKAEVSLLLGLLRLNRDSQGQILPSELTSDSHTKHMYEGKDASDPEMYNILRHAAKS